MPEMDNHKVIMVKRIDTVEWAYGKFNQKDIIRNFNHLISYLS